MTYTKGIFSILIIIIFNPIYAFTQIKNDRICIPGIKAGAITKNTSEKELIELFGKELVIRSNINIGEGLNVHCTVVFSGSKDEIRIIWKDTINFSLPEMVIIDKSGTSWKTESGICIGISLKEIEKLNNKHFVVLGFGWDYSGTVISWNNGKLTKPDQKENGIIIRLNYDKTLPLNLTESELSEITGDKELFSSNKILQKINPQVYQMIILFNN